MKLINGFDLMNYAKLNHYILPAFNTTNLEMCYAIVKGLSDADRPGYVQISSSNLRLSCPEIIAETVRCAAKDSDTPIGLHLDHGKSFEDVKACIEAGFTSIMVDYSQLPFEENIQKTRMISDYCHFYGLPVEAELGSLVGKEDDVVAEEDMKTNPDDVAEFVERTRCDVLAVSVGNVHGLSIDPQIDLPLLQKIHRICPVPLVLHGGSGIPADVIMEAKKSGLIKINYGAAIRYQFIKTFGEAYEQDHNAHSVIELSMAAVENVSTAVRELTAMINQ